MSFFKLVEQELMEVDVLLTEITARKTRRVRKGKVVKKRKCPHGYTVKGTRCVRQKSKERITRKRAGRKAARKGKAARKRTFKRSIRLRQRRKLKRQKFG